MLRTSWLFALLIFIACSPKNKPAGTTAIEPTRPNEPTVYDDLDKSNDDDIEDAYPLGELVIEPDALPVADSLPIYHATHTHQVDLDKVTLDLRFDWAKKHVLGKATLDMTPWFYALDKVELDAKNFDVHSVLLNNQKVNFTYDGLKLTVPLGKTYKKSEKIQITVDYTAKPDERENIGGSAAISQDKGLYFINADGSDPTKPKQIWTQGETESNSFWFPVVDKPNKRCLQEMFLTVDGNFKTLSNGILVGSRNNADGTRTDQYRMDQPHAPYLFMLAVGEFSVVKDRWRGIELEYYVEPEYEKDARAIFRYTDEMLTFFSEKLNYPYPWQKYSQIIVRDFVSGAMENTTGVIFGDFVQMTERELLDEHLANEKIVAHEMFHHWFGDLVTCESWSNLTLNEGFANYSEYLWFEHKYGREEADFHLIQEQQGYKQSTGGVGHPLIDYDYGNREDMFDAISYNKGGAVLHMLRKYLGDEAFWAGLNRYLTDNKYSAVETDELRMAFEDVSGEDLNWFFDQWYLGAGMPVLNMEYNWDAATNQMFVTLEQTQAPTDEVPAIFNLPMKVDIYEADGKVRRENIRMTKRKQVFPFTCSTKPNFVNVDAEKSLLCDKVDNHSEAEWRFILKNGPLLFDRLEAIGSLYNELADDQELVVAMLSDKAWPIREVAAEMADLSNASTLEAMKIMAENDPKSSVRAAAISALATVNGEDFSALFEKNLGSDRPYSVVGAALNALSSTAPEKAISAAKALENEKNGRISASISELYAASPKPEQAAFFAEKSKTIDQMAAFGLFENYANYLLGLNDEAVTNAALENFRKWGNDITGQSQWRRFAATKAIADVRNGLQAEGKDIRAGELSQWISEIMEKETDPTLKMYYGMF